MSAITESDVQRCNRLVDEVLSEVNTVQYLVWHINRLGGRMHRSTIKCIDHTATSSGADAGSITSGSAQAGYMWRSVSRDISHGDIALRADALTSRELVERSLRHELVHAYDDARGFVDPQDCYHHACSEIRAARLSGDCLGTEVAGGWTEAMTSGLQCVRRRATLAVENNPVCKSFSDRAVEKVFEKCYTDYEPFVAPIYAMGNYGYQSVNVNTGAFEGGYFQRWKEMSAKRKESKS